MKLDKEIQDLEQRIQQREAELARVTREAGRSARDALASPAALAIAVGAGFLLGGGFGDGRAKVGSARDIGRRRRRTDRGAARKLAGLLGAGAVTLLRSRYGSPAALAHLLMSRTRHR